MAGRFSRPKRGRLEIRGSFWGPGVGALARPWGLTGSREQCLMGLGHALCPSKILSVSPWEDC